MNMLLLHFIDRIYSAVLFLSVVVDSLIKYFSFYYKSWQGRTRAFVYRGGNFFVPPLKIYFLILCPPPFYFFFWQKYWQVFYLLKNLLSYLGLVYYIFWFHIRGGAKEMSFCHKLKNIIHISVQPDVVDLIF